MSETESTDFGVETIDTDGQVADRRARPGRPAHAPELRSAIGAALDGGARASWSTSPRRRSSTRRPSASCSGPSSGSASGGKVSIVCADPHVRRIFEITLLDRVFSLHGDRDSARGSAGGGA